MRPPETQRYNLGITIGMSNLEMLGFAKKCSTQPTPTGATKYFEYGRYDKADFGLVRNRKVPDLVIKNGGPTPESLDNLYRTISERYGESRNVTARYYPDAHYQKVIDFALQRMHDKKRAPYNFWYNNCKTFAQGAIDAGRD